MKSKNLRHNHRQNLHLCSQADDHLTNAEYITHISEPYYVAVVLFVRTLSEDIIRYIFAYFKKESFDLSPRTIRRLKTSISAGNFENFKTIYDYSLSNIKILNNHGIFNTKHLKYILNLEIILLLPYVLL